MRKRNVKHNDKDDLKITSTQDSDIFKNPTMCICKMVMQDIFV